MNATDEHASMGMSKSACCVAEAVDGQDTRNATQKQGAMNRTSYRFTNGEMVSMHPEHASNFQCWWNNIMTRTHSSAPLVAVPLRPTQSASVKAASWGASGACTRIPTDSQTKQTS